MAKADLKVAIVGGLAERKNWKRRKGFEVWGLNAIRPQWLDGSWSRMFNLHRHDLLMRYGWPVNREYEWVGANPDIPFITVDMWPRLKSVIFPRAKLKFPMANYHCGSFDWMVAYAMHLGAVEIALHGIRLGFEAGEPLSSRACLEYRCGMAAGRGIKITLSPDTDLFTFYHLVKSHLIYGYEDTPVVEDRTKKGVPYTYDRD